MCLSYLCVKAHTPVHRPPWKHLCNWYSFIWMIKACASGLSGLREASKQLTQQFRPRVMQSLWAHIVASTALTTSRYLQYPIVHHITLDLALSSNTDWKKQLFCILWWGCWYIAVVHPTHWLKLALSHLLAFYRYSIDRRTDMDHLFNVHPGNGSVFLLKSLDREETAWHNISIIATELRKSSRGRDCLLSIGWCDVLRLIKKKSMEPDRIW